MRERGRQITEREERESRELSREPTVGLDPRTTGSQPKPKEDAQSTEPTGHPLYYNLFFTFREKCVSKPQMLGGSTLVFCTF